MKTKYEYLIINFVNEHAVKMEQILNDYGEDGWLLITMENGLAYMVRKKNSEEIINYFN